MAAVEFFEELVVGVMREFMRRHLRQSTESQTLRQCLVLAKASKLDFAGKSVIAAITATIRHVCDDPAHAVTARIALFQLLAEAESLDDPAEEKHVPLFYQTQAYVRSAWPGRLVPAADVANEAARRALFQQLHELCCSETEADTQKVQIAALADTLSLWLDDTDKDSGASSYCDFWMHVFRQSAATESVGWVGLAGGITVDSDGVREVTCSRNVRLHVGEELEIMASLDSAVAKSSPVAAQWNDAVLAFGMASRFAEVKALATSGIADSGASLQGHALSPAFVKTAAATDMVEHLAAGAYFKPVMTQFVAQIRTMENCETLTEAEELLWSGNRISGQLHSAGLWPQHGLLAMLLRYVPDTFQTLDVALFVSSA